MSEFSSHEPSDRPGSINAQSVEFDPVRDLFVAQSHRPKSLREINLRALTPFQRALLVIDGTVTKFIEAFTLEPVEILHLLQDVRTLSEDHVWLDISKGTEVMVRQVVLQGKHSGTFHAFATSLLVPKRLGPSVHEAVAKRNFGLGRILLSGQIETRREVLWYGIEPRDDQPSFVRSRVFGELISRTYRIIAGGCPIMLINEKFPTGSPDHPSQY